MKKIKLTTNQLHIRAQVIVWMKEERDLSFQQIADIFKVTKAFIKKVYDANKHYKFWINH